MPDAHALATYRLMRQVAIWFLTASASDTTTNQGGTIKFAHDDLLVHARYWWAQARALDAPDVPDELSVTPTEQTYPELLGG